MDPRSDTIDGMNYGSQLGKYFLSGALFLLPAAFFVQFLFYISGLVGGVIDLPFLWAFPLSLLLIIATGFFVRKVLRKRFKKSLHKLAKRKTPIGYIVRGLVGIDSVSNQINKAYRNAVLFKVDDGIYKLGFITDESLDILESGDDETHYTTEATPHELSVWVYAPYPISLSGDLMLVEVRKIKKIIKEEYESLPLFILSAGMIKGKK